MLVHRTHELISIHIRFYLVFWIGLILMALVTSLAELIIKISAVTIVKAPILAPRDVLSSCVFNLLILSVLDTRIRQPLFQSFNPVLLSSNFWTSV